MKNLYKILILSVATFFLFQYQCTNLSGIPRPEKPNVVMIIVDDLNNWIGALGGPAKTPHIDRLAEKGMLFTNAYCVSPSSNPSRTALLTGYRPESTGQCYNKGRFRNLPGGDSIVTLPQYFKNHGYETVAAGKVFHKVKGVSNIILPSSDPQSWDKQWKKCLGTSGHEQYTDEYGYAHWADSIWKPTKTVYWGPISDPDTACGDWKHASCIVNYIKQTHEKPFFAAYGVFRPHLPWLVPQKYFDMYPVENISLPKVKQNSPKELPHIYQSNLSHHLFQAVKAMGRWKEGIQAYLASVSFADACIGNILDALDNSIHKNNTIVLLTGDHGWMHGQKHMWGEGVLWHQCANTPLIVKSPGITKAGTICDESVSLLDIYPTLIDLANLPEKTGLEGRSLFPLLEDPGKNWPYPAVITYGPNNVSVINEEWNYITYKNDFEELYHRSTDPHEWNNMAQDSQYEQVKKQLKQWIPKHQVPVGDTGLF